MNCKHCRSGRRHLRSLSRSVAAIDNKRADWLIRATKSRPLLNKNGKRKANNLWESVQLEKVCCYVDFEMPARKNKKARTVKQAVRVKK
jgi:hypothetical protein